MADLRPAKAGDVVTAKALKALARAGGHAVETIVRPKTEGNAGQWFCIDCGELPQNNMGAWGHAEAHPKHRFAWRNFKSGELEEP